MQSIFTHITCFDPNIKLENRDIYRESDVERLNNKIKTIELVLKHSGFLNPFYVFY